MHFRQWRKLLGNGAPHCSKRRCSMPGKERLVGKMLEASYKVYDDVVSNGGVNTSAARGRCEATRLQAFGPSAHRQPLALSIAILPRSKRTWPWPRLLERRFNSVGA